MSLPLIIISAITTIVAIILGLSLRKYQKLSYEKQTENRKLSDEFSQRIKEKESTISQHEHQLSDLEQKIQTFDTEKNKIYEQAIKANTKENDISNDKYKQNIIQLKKYNDEITQKNNNLSTQLTNKIQTFRKEIEIFQDDNFNILDEKIDLSSLQISNPNKLDSDSKIPLLQIINASNLKKDTEYIATEKTTENNNITLSYAIIFSGNAEAFIIDGELSDFLINNYELIKGNVEQIKSDLNTTLKHRIDFLSDNNFQSEIINTINQLDSISKIENIFPCIYIPSENIANMLHTIDPDFFSYANTKKIPHYTPAGIINLILHTKNSLFAEKNIIRFQILSDIIEEDLPADEDIIDEPEDIIEDTKLSQEPPTTIDELTDEKTNQDNKNEEIKTAESDKPENIKNINEPSLNTPPTEEQIPATEEPDISLKNNDSITDTPATKEKNNAEITDTEKSQPQTETLETNQKNEPEINIDKFNIGNFLDNEESLKISETPEDEISRIADDIAKDNPIDQTLKPRQTEEDRIEENETKDVITDFNNEAEKILTDPTTTETTSSDVIAKTNDTDNPPSSPIGQEDTINTSDISPEPTTESPAKTEAPTSTESQKPPLEENNDEENTSSTQDDKNKNKDSFKNIDPKDFDIESFLNES